MKHYLTKMSGYWAWVALGVLFVGSVSAQITTGTISGRIVDETGGVIPGAAIQLTSVGTAQTWATVTGDTGDFKFTFLKPGEYTVLTELAGFRPVLRRDIVVQVAETATVDITVTPSEIREVIEVVGATPALKSESGAIGDVVEHETIVDLPLNGRNFIELVKLQPGAVSTAKITNGRISFHTSIFGGNYAVHGAPSEGTVFLLDGIDMKDAVDTRVGFRMTVDAVREFNFQAMNYSSAFGRASGGVINIASMGGSNDWHGSAWYFFRDDTFDSRSFFAEEKDPFRQHQYGVAVGGPIVKDSTFFFVSYDATRNDKEVTRAATVPTELMRQGDFTEGPTIFNPMDRDPDGFRRPFPNNLLPAGAQDQVALNGLRLWPLPNRSGTVNNLVDSGSQEIIADQLNVRIDQQLGDSDTVFGRYTLVKYDRLWPFVFASLPNFTTVWNSPAQNAVIGHTHTFGASSVNEFRYGFNRHTQVLEDIEQERNVAQELGLMGLSPRFLGNPNFRVSGIGTTGVISNAPNNRSDNQFSLRENFSHIKGRHSLSMGLALDWYQMNGGSAPNAHGGYGFNGTFTSGLEIDPGTGVLVRTPDTGNPFADYLMGFPSSSGRCCIEEDGFRNYRKYDIGVYFHDDWKASPKLTINLGVRWEFFEPAYEQRLRFAQPDYTQAPEQVLTFSGVDGVPKGIREAEYNNFAPRFGWAYKLGDKTVLRGGYGLFYMSTNMVYAFRLAAGAPFVLRENFTSDPITPQFTLENAFPSGLGVPSISYASLDLGWRDPYNQNWNLTLQHELQRGVVLSASYLGNKGTKLIHIFNANAPFFAEPGSLGPRRPVPSFSNDTRQENSGRSIYHGLELKGQKRFSEGLGFLASYVWSKCIDTGNNQINGDGSPFGGRDPRDHAEDRGPCNNDVRHRAATNFIYAPSIGQGGSGVGSALIRDWRYQGIIILEGGQPFPARLNFDNSNTGNNFDYPDLVSGQDPNDGPKTVEQFFNVNAFTDPAPFTYGNAGRNITRGPGFANVEFSIHRLFPITESQRIEFRAEFFNLFNHTNFLQPANRFGTGTFGVLSGAFLPREIQFAVKYVF